MNVRPGGGSTSSEVLTRRTACRGCNGNDLVMFLSLGEVPLANSFLRADQLGNSELRFPLEVFFCRTCALVQLLHVVNPEVLFSNYIYRSGTNRTIEQHNAGLAQAAVSELRLGGNDLIAEIASNDGSLLQSFREHGVRVVGVEPAKNIAQLAREAGIETIEEFFDARAADALVRTHGLASVVIANNVLAHVDATQEFLLCCRKILRPQGRVIIEVPYLVEMIQRMEYDTIYHEHLCYFSVSSLMPLFSYAGLALDRIDRVEIHGGSLRLWAKHAGGQGHAPEVRELAEKEAAAGLRELRPYQEFAGRVRSHREKLLSLLRRLKDEGKSIVGYGAPAKGNTLLCYCGIGTDFLPYTVDMSPLKVGFFTPGSHIPVCSFDRIFREQPDYVLLLAWNFAPEIMKTLDSYRKRGGRFILPIPEPTII